MKAYYSFFLCILMLSFGCSKDTTTGPDNTGTVKHTIPKAGSTFKYSLKNLDDLDTVIEFEVLATGLEIYGKKNVSRFVSGNNSLFVAYESNGDFAIIFETQDSIWSPMPVASKKQMSSLMVTRPSGDGTRTEQMICTPFKEDAVVVGGKSLPGYQIEEINVVHYYDKNGSLEDTYRDTTYYTWSHEIGLWTKVRPEETLVDLLEYQVK